MRSSYFSRRGFLGGLGAGLSLLPMLRPAHGQSAFPKRLLIVVQTNGTIADAFFPQGTGSDLNALTFPAITKPLEKHKNDLLFVENLELKHFNELKNNGGAHDNYAVVFTGEQGEQRSLGDPRGFRPPFPVKPTVDEHIAAGLTKAGVKTPLAKLHLGVQIENAGTNQKRCFWRGKDQPISPENNPAKAASTIFGGGTMPDPAFERLRAERKSMLDFLGRDLERFSKRFGADERSKIESHLASVRDIEKQVANVQKLSCQAPMVPAALADTRAQPDARYKDIMNVQFDIATAALACDVTRIATVQLNNGHGNGVVYSWVGIEGKGMEFGVRDSHDLAHRPGAGNADKIKVETWYAQQFAALLDRMKAVKEGDGTLLDHTCVLWINHMGNGGAHSSTKLPWVIAGKANGYFKTGQFRRSPTSVNTNGVLAALCNAMGVQTEIFGDPAYGGQLPGLKA